MEKLRILDENGNDTGEIMDRDDKRLFDKGIYHLAVDVWIINSENKLLIQKRSKNKKLFPNIWAMTGGSVILNETSQEAIVREAKEELDIDINISNLKLFTKFRTDNIWMDAYILKADFDIDKMKFLEDEVDDVKWVTIDELELLIQNNEFINHRWEFVGDLIKKEIEANNKKEEYVKKMSINPDFEVKSFFKGYHLINENLGIEVDFIDMELGHEYYQKETKSIHIYYIIEGSGIACINGSRYKIEKGDTVEIPTNTEYAFKGKLKMIEIMDPPYNPNTHIDTRKNDL